MGLRVKVGKDNPHQNFEYSNNTIWWSVHDEFRSQFSRRIRSNKMA
ncbi:MAG: hypothetical protein QXE37_01445 [Nitrososphaerales archaeon]